MTPERIAALVALLREAATALCTDDPTLTKRLDRAVTELSPRDDRRDHDRFPARPL